MPVSHGHDGRLLCMHERKGLRRTVVGQRASLSYFQVRAGLGDDLIPGDRGGTLVLAAAMFSAVR